MPGLRQPRRAGASFCAACGRALAGGPRTTLSLSPAQLLGGLLVVAVLSAALVGGGVLLGSRAVAPAQPAPSAGPVPAAAASSSPAPSGQAIATPGPTPSATAAPTPDATPTASPSPRGGARPARRRGPRPPRPSTAPPSLHLGIAPFRYDPTSSESLHYQQHFYLYTFIKPCPRAGCETVKPDPRLSWMNDYVWEGPIPAQFQPCLTNPDGAACYRAVVGH